MRDAPIVVVANAFSHIGCYTDNLEHYLRIVVTDKLSGTVVDGEISDWRIQASSESLSDISATPESNAGSETVESDGGSANSEISGSDQINASDGKEPRGGSCLL